MSGPKERHAASIRPMEADDAEAVLEMMKLFYASDALLDGAPDEALEHDIADCVGDCPFVEGFVFDDGGKLAGYAMIAKSYSTERGGPCIWIEDLFLMPDYRGCGLAARFFEFVEGSYPEAVRLRLEAAPSNAGAIAFYRSRGYKELRYTQFVKEK